MYIVKKRTIEICNSQCKIFKSSLNIPVCRELKNIIIIATPKTTYTCTYCRGLRLTSKYVSIFTQEPIIIGKEPYLS